MICDLITLLEVLEAGPSGETTLAIRANLDGRSTSRSVNLMQALGLVTRSNSHIQISEKGLLLLERHEELKGIREVHDWKPVDSVLHE